MKKVLLVIIIIVISIPIINHFVKKEDISNSFELIIERLTTKKPEKNTMEMVTYIKEKADKDTRLNNKKTLWNSLNYIKNNLDKCDNTTLENLIYYGYILEFSPKESSEGLYTTIGLKTVDLAKEVYIKDNRYQKNRNKFDKTKVQIVKALISRVDK